jgi:hypothetical protein
MVWKNRRIEQRRDAPPRPARAGHHTAFAAGLSIEWLKRHGGKGVTVGFL